MNVDPFLTYLPSLQLNTESLSFDLPLVGGPPLDSPRIDEKCAALDEPLFTTSNYVLPSLPTVIPLGPSVEQYPSNISPEFSVEQYPSNISPEFSVEQYPSNINRELNSNFQGESHIMNYSNPQGVVLDTQDTHNIQRNCPSVGGSNPNNIQGGSNTFNNVTSQQLEAIRLLYLNFMGSWPTDNLPNSWAEEERHIALITGFCLLIPVAILLLIGIWYAYQQRWIPLATLIFGVVLIIMLIYASIAIYRTLVYDSTETYKNERQEKSDQELENNQHRLVRLPTLLTAISSYLQS